jgi:tetratricopeptide (TPR) repeat protein
VSAQREYELALTAYARGELHAAAAGCAAALRATSLDPELTVRLSYLYLRATELWWQLNPTEDVSRLVDRAQDAADRTGDRGLDALIRCLRGRYLIATNGLAEAVRVFAEAAALADESGDRLARLETLSELGHHQVGQNLERGLRTLARAQAVAEEPDPGAAERPLLLVTRAKLDGLVGVAIFDDGRFSEAETWLRRSVDGLRALGAWDQAALISNYLGQLLVAMGRFEEAEALLAAVLEPLRADADLSTFQGYNLGLLGKLYLEWDRLEDAETNLEAGWKRLERTRHQAILPLLRNYRGELIMHPRFHARDVDAAGRLFEETVTECRRTGFLRSEIMALSLLALASLARGRDDLAASTSRTAIEKLAAAGTLPALRSEEIYFTHSLALAAAGDRTGSSWYLEQAREVLAAKAATITDPVLREQFLTRVPVSAAITRPR